MEELILCYFNIRNFKIPKLQPFYIWWLDNLYPTQKFQILKVKIN